MPIYEYICSKCENTEEVLQKVGEDAPKECSHCKAGGTMSKAVSQSAFHLKGGGWYKDLYASTKKNENSGGKSTGTSEKPAKEKPSDSSKKSNDKKE